MLIKSIKLKDFRQFAGNENFIEFATNPDENVTLIIADNGTGKTTLSQAFTWCLYGVTNFAVKSVLCNGTGQKMGIGDTTDVIVILNLIHGNKEYTIKKTQSFKKEGPEKFKSSNPIQTINVKLESGGMEPSNQDPDQLVNQILPKDLAHYFFFDGEHLENMGKEIKTGQSAEFANAVKSILGLDALTSALEHMKSKSPNKQSVLKSYADSYDHSSNTKIVTLNKEIRSAEDEKERKKARKEEILLEQELCLQKQIELGIKIESTESGRRDQQEKDRLLKEKTTLLKKKVTDKEKMLSLFNQGYSNYFSQKLMIQAKESLAHADKVDRGIPSVNKDSIHFLINRGYCLCGTHLTEECPEKQALLDNLKYIPPESLGTLITQFTNDCDTKQTGAGYYFTNIKDVFASIRGFDEKLHDIEERITVIEKRLIGFADVGNLQLKINQQKKYFNDLEREKNTLTIDIDKLTTTISDKETAQKNLAVMSESNKKTAQYRAYAEAIYKNLLNYYKTKEEETRQKLESTINEIFSDIFTSGFSLKVDGDYNISVVANGYENPVEPSTAQSISVIFAFIAGVIKMAREAQNDAQDDLISEPYPLIMDAPLSSFDKTRIKRVCDFLPLIAEQVVFFVHDTSGDLAEENMASKIGKRYRFQEIVGVGTAVLGENDDI